MPSALMPFCRAPARSAWTLPALIVLAVGALAGCGSGQTIAQSPTRSSSRALAAVIVAATATAKTSETVTMSPLVARSPVHATGQFDFRRGSGRLNLTAVGAQGSSGRPRPWAIIFLPGAAYEQPPAESKWELPRGKRWISVDLTRASSVAVKLPLFIPQMESFNPLISLGELMWGAVAATVVDPKLGSGAQRIHYRVTVDLQSALSHARGPNATALLAALGSGSRSLSSSAEGGGRTRVELNVWVDARGRVVRLDAPALARMDGKRLDFREESRAVTVRPPARARSIDVGSITPSGERENAGGGDSDGA